MISIREALQQARSVLGEYSPTAALDAEVLLMAVLQCERTYLYTWPERSLSQLQQTQFQQALDKRLQGIPVAYITGSREFWGLELSVSEQTLIPRPETELLVELVLEKVNKENASLLDLGTGTGAIALAIASEKPNWQIMGVDSSPQALQVAECNSQRLQLAVNWQCSHWFNAIPNTTFDVIVSNPPYIDQDDPHLKEGDVRFEPRSALVADQQGLSDLSTIIHESRDYLVPLGHLFLEHGWQQGPAVRQLMQQAEYIRVETHRDLAGHDRITSCVKAGSA